MDGDTNFFSPFHWIHGDVSTGQQKILSNKILFVLGMKDWFLWLKELCCLIPIWAFSKGQLLTLEVLGVPHPPPPLNLLRESI